MKKVTPIKDSYTPKAKIINKDSVFLSTLDPSNKKHLIKELHILHPAFRNKVIKLLYECKKQGIDLRIVETYRTPERQNHLKRRQLTMLSGGYSKHQHFIAIDIVPVINGKYQWHNYKLWNRIGKIGTDLGLTWGGNWRIFKDWGHFELPIPIDSIKYIPVPDTVFIPLNY
jgi:hypothetical protein